MKVLIAHGYLLRGTGSNVYNASLAAALARLGHEVHLLCQDRRAVELSWVDAAGIWEDGRLRVEPFPELSEAELDAYLDANVTAVRDVVERLGGVDAALANHLVMGPVILA